MNALRELKALLTSVLPVETGVFSQQTPDTYAVLTPLIDLDGLFGDDAPAYEVQEIRISLYTKTNYLALKNSVLRLLRGADFTVTEKRYLEHEDDTGYYHYAIDVAKHYETEE